jgi:hypothetical protein
MAWFWFIVWLVTIIAAVWLYRSDSGIRDRAKQENELVRRGSKYLRELVLILGSGELLKVQAWIAKVDGYDDSYLKNRSSKYADDNPDTGVMSKHELTRLGKLFFEGSFRDSMMYSLGDVPIVSTVAEAELVNKVEAIRAQGVRERDYQAQIQQIEVMKLQNEVHDARAIEQDYKLQIQSMELEKQRMEIVRLQNEENLRVTARQTKLRIKEETPRVVAEAQKQERSLLHERWVNLLNMMGLALQTTVLVKTELRDHLLGQELVERFNHVYNEVRRIDPSAQMDEKKVVEAVERMMLRNMGLFDDDKNA